MEARTQPHSDTCARTGCLNEVMNDARNMATALGLYCELIDEPGVLTNDYRHYAKELNLVAAASRRLVERLMFLAIENSSFGQALSESMFASPDQPRLDFCRDLPPVLIVDMARELESNRNLLVALAGPTIQVSVEMDGGDLSVQMSSEDLTRVLVNLIKNAVEALPKGGNVQLRLREVYKERGSDPWVLLNVEDNGPGFASEALERAFEPGYTTRTRPGAASREADHRGLGLSITRSLVEAAGGCIRVANRDPAGACIQIELPTRVSQGTTTRPWEVK